jgi:hypothetical protein
MADKPNKQGANPQFAKVQRASDAKTAAMEYEAAAAAMRAKTERLRALRLAHEANAPPPAAAKPKRQAKKPKGSLSDFLDGQEKEGRNG